jgi:hypothetical protein
MGVPEGGPMPAMPGDPQPMPAGLLQPQEGLIQPGEAIGMGGQKKINTPSIPQVPKDNMYNPEFQEQVMNNVANFPSMIPKSGK